MPKAPFSSLNLLLSGLLAVVGTAARAQGPGGPPAPASDPLLIGYAPANNGVAPRVADLQFTFRKPVVLPGGSPVAAWGSQSGQRTGTLTGSGTRQVRFDPTHDWLPGEEVTVFYKTTPATLDQAVPTQALLSPSFYRFRVAPAPAAGPLAVQPTPPTTGLLARQVATADLDGDGKAEVVLAGTLAGGAGEVRILRAGPAGYTVLSSVTTTATGNFGLGDVNNDGTVDLLVSDGAAAGATVAVYFNLGTGIFGGAPSRTTSAGPGAARLQVVDIDADGLLDLLTVNSDRTVSKRLNDGTGGLQANATPTNSFANLRTAVPVRGNDANRESLLVGSSADVQLCGQNGSGNYFSPGTLVASGISPVNDLAAADFTGGGTAAYVIATTNGLVIARRSGNSYQTTTLLPGESCTAVQPADVDGDGDLDLLVALSATQAVRVLRNDGTGTLTPEAPQALGAAPAGLAVADLNADNTLDAVTANGLTSASATVLLNSGPSGPRSVVVSTPQKLSGTYIDVTVTGTGSLTLAADLTVLGTLTVQAGGQLRPAGYRVLGAGNVSVLAGATLEVVAPAGLASSGGSGDFQNTGSRVFSSEVRYEFRGMTAQQTGTGLPATVKELVVDNPVGVTLTSPTAISSALWLTSGNLVSNGKLTLLGSAAGTAMVINNDGVVEGNATMQRFISGAANPGPGYRHLSSPVQSTTFQDLATAGFAPVVNPVFNGAANPLAVRPFPRIFGYDENRVGGAAPNFGQGYYSPGALADPMVPGKGYTVYLRPTARPDFTGVLNNGTIGSGLLTRGNEAESGWQLMGNPYPSPLVWDALASTLPAAMSRQVSVYCSTGSGTGTYVTRLNGVSTPDPNGVLADGRLAPMQGFFVRVAQPGTTQFSFTNQVRSSSVVPVAAYRAAAVPQLHLRIAAAATPAQTDYATVYCAANATPGLETAFDASKPRSEGAPTLFTRAVGSAEPLALNGIGLLTDADVVLPIGLEVPTAGTYHLTATAADLPAGWRAVLEDALTGTAHELLPEAPYTLTLPAGAVPSHRLRLRLTRGGIVAGLGQGEGSPVGFSLSPNPAHDVVNVHLPAGANQPVELLDATGRVVRTVEARAAGVLPLHGLPAGVYVVRSGGLTRRLVVQ